MAYPNNRGQKPADPPPVEPTTRSPLETLPAASIYQKIQELLEDFENGHITEEQLGLFLQELHIKDQEHFLDKMDEYNEELRLRLQKIELAKLALDVAGIVQLVTTELANDPSLDQQQKASLNKALNTPLVNINDLGDPKQVADGINETINTLKTKQRELSGHGAEKLQQHVTAMKDIAMGLKADYLGSTRSSLGTGIVLQGPLGEILGLGFDKLQVEADNDGAKYITGFISTQRNELAAELRTTARYIKNRPELTGP